MTAQRLKELIYLHFEGNQKVPLSLDAIRYYEEGGADGDLGVMQRLRGTHSLNDLRNVESEFILFAIPEAARFILGSYLLAATEVEEVMTDGEPEECYRDCLLWTLAGGRNPDASAHAANQYSLLTISQAQVVKASVEFIIENKLVTSGSDFESAKFALGLFWGCLPDIA